MRETTEGEENCRSIIRFRNLRRYRCMIKLFDEEENSIKTRNMLYRAQAMGTGLLTRAELGAALARGFQEASCQKR